MHRNSTKPRLSRELSREREAEEKPTVELQPVSTSVKKRSDNGGGSAVGSGDLDGFGGGGIVSSGELGSTIAGPNDAARSGADLGRVSRALESDSIGEGCLKSSITSYQTNVSTNTGDSNTPPGTVAQDAHAKASENANFVTTITV
eukprot:1080578-Amorphochlora_amoeboformis.AAC.3